MLNKAISQDLSLIQIKDQISTLQAARKPEEDENHPSLKGQIDDVLRLARRSKVWTDPKKQKRLEKVLEELKSIISDMN